MAMMGEEGGMMHPAAKTQALARVHKTLDNSTLGPRGSSGGQGRQAGRKTARVRTSAAASQGGITG